MTAPLCTGLGRHDGILQLEMRSDPKFTQPLTPGSDFAYELEGRRSCIGYRAPGASSLQPCPAGETGISANQCPDCFRRSRILPCLRCDGERCANPARREDCVQPENHAVYLAAFATGMYKVGVARWERRRERLAEQGARAAIIIARDDGQMVRRLEMQIKNLRDSDGETLIPDRRMMGEKLHGLLDPVSQEELQEQLLLIWDRNRNRVQGRQIQTPERVTLPEAQAIPYVPEVVKAKAGMRLRGRIVSVIGQTMVVDSDSGQPVALDVGSLVGYSLRELQDREAGQSQLVMSF